MVDSLARPAPSFPSFPAGLKGRVPVPLPEIQLTLVGLFSTFPEGQELSAQQHLLDFWRER